ncbi:MAG: MFS transporter [Gemmatimonadaceae bacterium]
MNDFPVRRNTALLAAAMAMQSATFQLSAAMSSITFVLVTGTTSLLGLGPALTMVAAALTALPAGRLMDRVGRIPVLAGGFLAGASGTALLSLGAHTHSALAAIPGFILLGAAGATGQLARAAAGDMYPASRRARGIAYVLFGSVFGAILGPLVFAPIFRGRELSAQTLVLPWLAASAMMLIAFLIVINIRPDPKRIAESIEKGDSIPPSPALAASPLAAILRRPGVAVALIAGVVSFAIMGAVMNLTGYVVVQHLHHPQHMVFPIIGAHVLGMYLFMPAVGWVVDRAGRTRTLAAGLAILAVSTAGLTWSESVVPVAILLFGLGLGWNLSFVAATSQLADLASATERGKLLGFNDLLAGLSASVLVLLGGFVLDDYGVAALSLGASAIAVAPIVFILMSGHSSTAQSQA